MLSPDVTAKLFGVGLGAAVLLDATLVRMVLVPAAMSLLGHRAWWLPAPLARVLPTIDLEGTGHLAGPGASSGTPVGDEPEEGLDREAALV